LINKRIYLAGHNGMVGSAIFRQLEQKKYSNLITRNLEELNLIRQEDVEAFFKQEKPLGRYRIWVCRSLSCAACGGEELLALFEKRLDVLVAGSDGRLVGVQCLVEPFDLPGQLGLRLPQLEDFGLLLPDLHDLGVVLRLQLGYLDAETVEIFVGARDGFVLLGDLLFLSRKRALQAVDPLARLLFHMPLEDAQSADEKEED